jgi:pterin-4a-carbinolamine dehydratase
MPGLNSELVLGKILERAIDTKKKVGQIYLRFAELFSHVPEVENFWKRMNFNQTTHADWLKEIKESLTEEQILSLPEVEWVLKTHSIKNLFDKHSAKEIDNLHDAYLIAHEIEFSEVNELFKMLSNEFISSEEKRNIILNAIDIHQQQIMDLPGKFNNGTMMKDIKVEDSREPSLESPVLRLDATPLNLSQKNLTTE